jgi:hypothetical protein
LPPDAGGKDVFVHISAASRRAAFLLAINEQAPQSLRCEPTYPPFSERSHLPAVLSQKS